MANMTIMVEAGAPEVMSLPLVLTYALMANFYILCRSLHVMARIRHGSRQSAVGAIVSAKCCSPSKRSKRSKDQIQTYDNDS